MSCVCCQQNHENVEANETDRWCHQCQKDGCPQPKIKLRTTTIDLPDFRLFSKIDAIEFLRAQKSEFLEPLIRWVAEAEAFERSNYEVRLAIANGERYAKGLCHEPILK